MSPTTDSLTSDHRPPTSSLATLAILSLLVGAAAGFLGAMFRLALDQANVFRNALADWAHGYSVFGLPLIIIACAAATALAAWLVRRFSPRAAGSGIPHVEAVLNEELPPASFWLIPVKFFGGILAIGAGLALGREGPSVQMGASLAHLIGKTFRRSWPDCRVLIAAGAGAGLATAFNAPIAGAIFVLEELVRRFETRIAIAALGASATAMAVARMFLGDGPEFQVFPLPYPSSAAHVLFFTLGAVAGLAAVVYNKTILAAINLSEKHNVWPVELRAALIGAAVGLLVWFTPDFVGGGESLTQQTLSGALTFGTLAAVFALRFGLGAVSYAAKTPGGLFAPMLVLGAQLGLLFAGVCQLVLPNLAVPPDAFAVVGMAAFFTGVVRAPVTGIVLIIEMTGSLPMLLPMLGACFAAMLIPTLLGNAPIYESLRDLDARQSDSSRS
jgi:chloride channel protein, CIC family